jgi:hypothetical protein
MRLVPPSAEKATDEAAARLREALLSPGVAFSAPPLKRRLGRLRRGDVLLTGPMSDAAAEYLDAGWLPYRVECLVDDAGEDVEGVFVRPAYLTPEQREGLHAAVAGLPGDSLVYVRRLGRGAGS